MPTFTGDQMLEWAWTIIAAAIVFTVLAICVYRVIQHEKWREREYQDSIPPKRDHHL